MSSDLPGPDGTAFAPPIPSEGPRPEGRPMPLKILVYSDYA